MEQQQLIKAENNPGALIVSQVDRSAAATLLPAEKKIIEAALQPKIDEQPAVDVVTTFISIVTTAYTRAGYKMPDEATLALYADEFYSSLLEKYPRVTIPEVRDALKNGVYGDYGEFTGLNPKTFMQFIRGYLRSEERKGAIQLFESRRLFLNAQITLSPEQKETFNRNWVNDQFKVYLEGKLIVDFVPVDLYEFLYNNGHMPLTKEEKKQINERARSYHSRLKVSKRTKGNGNTRSIGEALNDYFNDGPAEDIVRNYSKRFAVLDFFEMKKNQGKTTIFEQSKLLQ